MSGEDFMNSVCPEHQAFVVARWTGITYIVYRMRFVFSSPHPPEKIDGMQTLREPMKGIDQGDHFRTS